MRSWKVLDFLSVKEWNPAGCVYRPMWSRIFWSCVFYFRVFGAAVIAVDMRGPWLNGSTDWSAVWKKGSENGYPTVMYRILAPTIESVGHLGVR